LSQGRSGICDPEGDKAADTAGLGLEVIGLEGGSFVLDVEFVRPIQVAKHERALKTDRTPFLKFAIDPRSAALKFLLATEEMTIVLQIMNLDFESVLKEPMAKLRGYFAIAHEDEVETDAAPEAYFDFGKLPRFLPASFAFDIMDQDEGKLFSVRPAKPSFERIFQTK
jgi:hypothetical protein